MLKPSQKIKLEQRGHCTVICSSPQDAMKIAISRQQPFGWLGGIVPPLYADEFPKRLAAGELVYFCAEEKEPIFMYPAHFKSRLEMALLEIAACEAEEVAA